MTQELSQEISVPVTVGDRVSLFKDVDKDEGGFIADTMFEDTISRYNPDTGLLRFENSDIGQAEFKEMLEEAEGIQIV